MVWVLVLILMLQRCRSHKASMMQCSVPIQSLYFATNFLVLSWYYRCMYFSTTVKTRQFVSYVKVARYIYCTFLETSITIFVTKINWSLTKPTPLSMSLTDHSSAWEGKEWKLQLVVRAKETTVCTVYTCIFHVNLFFVRRICIARNNIYCSDKPSLV